MFCDVESQEGGRGGGEDQTIQHYSQQCWTSTQNSPDLYICTYNVETKVVKWSNVIKHQQEQWECSVNVGGMFGDCTKLALNIVQQGWSRSDNAACMLVFSEIPSLFDLRA